MRKSGGVIVNNASVAALKGIADRCNYSASKGALVALTRSMAIDFIRDNIRVNCVCPGTTHTLALEERMQAAGLRKPCWPPLSPDNPWAAWERTRRFSQAILFACCDKAAYMTGNVIVIDGGAML